MRGMQRIADIAATPLRLRGWQPWLGCGRVGFINFDALFNDQGPALSTQLKGTTFGWVIERADDLGQLFAVYVCVCVWLCECVWQG